MSSRSRYLLRRAAHNVVTLWALVTIVFVLFRLLPGDPASVLVDPASGEAARQAALHAFGLDRPVLVQYGIYLGQLLHGQLGRSFSTRQPVLGMIAPAFLNTLLLVACSFAISYGLGSLIGIWMARRRGSFGEAAATTLTFVCRSAPTFWVGALAIILFSVRWRLLPISGMHTQGFMPAGFWQNYLSWDLVRHLVLPVLVGSLYFIGLPLLLMRNALLGVLQEDFVDLARVKGIGERAVLLRHAVRNALIPVVTESAVFISWALGGLVVIEYLFSWPGLGRAIVIALGDRDYPVAQGAFILISLMVLLLNLLADLGAAWLDPRVQLR